MSIRKIWTGGVWIETIHGTFHQKIYMAVENIGTEEMAVGGEQEFWIPESAYKRLVGEVANLQHKLEKALENALKVPNEN
jgi:hypothetical protein